MTPGLIVRLAGMEFVGRRFRWEPGVYVQKFDGIDSGGEISSPSIPRGRGPGALSLDNVRGTERIITIAGFIYARDGREMQDRMDQLGRLLAEDDEQGTLRWRRFDEKRQVTVRRHRTTPIVRRAGEPSFADFTLTLRAPDQRIYGDSTTSAWGSTVAVTHRGGYPAPVTVEVRGNSGGGYTITGPRGRAARVTRLIVPEQSHTYDADTGLLRVGGAPQTEGVARSDQIEIPYGSHQFTVDNGCELRVTFAPTWAP